MNKFFVNTIFQILEKSIKTGYESGIRSIINQNKKKFTYAAPPKIFDVRYTDTDIGALLNFRMNAFLVAGVGSYELQNELKEAGVDILESEEPDFDSFEIDVRRAMMSYGIGLGDQPPSGWIKQNIDTAIKNSYAGARWNRVKDPELNGLYTAWIYHSQQDERVRSEHEVLDGNVYDINDETASRILPPTDWGCRCYEEYVTAEEALKLDVMSPEDAKNSLEEVPEEFRYNPGNGKHVWRRWLEQKYHDMPESEYSKIKQMIKDHKF